MDTKEKIKSSGGNGASAAVAGKLFENHNNNLNVESSDKEQLGIGGPGTSDTDNFSSIININQNQEEILDFENFVQVTQKTMQKAELKKEQSQPTDKKGGKKGEIESDD